MGRSLLEANNEVKKKYNTLNNTYDMFPVGSRVKIICLCQDMTFFRGNETGVVTANSGRYLGIMVKFDNENMPIKEFNYEPYDLILMKDSDISTEHCDMSDVVPAFSAKAPSAWNFDQAKTSFENGAKKVYCVIFNKIEVKEASSIEEAEKIYKRSH